MNGALSGVKVLDFSEYIAGPYGAQMLADMGALVTKVEPPNGDFWRHTNSIAPAESRGFIGVNKGKRSISIDLKRESGREVAYRLIRNADVLVANYRAGVAARLGIDYETLAAVNPRLIYCENTAFGPVGPYAEKAGYDLVSQAATGIMAFEGGAGLPRSIITTSVTDISAGMFMAFAIASALYQRERTGRGQHIETSLFGAGVAIQYRPMLSIEKLDLAARAELLGAIDEARSEGRSTDEVLAAHAAKRLTGGSSGPYYHAYEALDGYFVVACLNNRLRRQAAEVFGVDDPRLKTDQFNLRLLSDEDALAIAQAMEDVARTRSVAEWCAALDARGVPCSPVRLSAEMFDDPHVQANELLVSLEHPVVGPIRMANSPLRMSGAETGAQSSAPALGQHTREVLEEAGYAPIEIEQLEQEGVVRSWQSTAVQAASDPGAE